MPLAHPSPPPRTAVAGLTLIELLVALILLQLTGAAVLAAVLTAERSSRHVASGVRTDAVRWTAYHAAEGDPACHDTGAPRADQQLFAGEEGRAPLPVTLGCGR